MIIIDANYKSSINGVTLLLTRSEALDVMNSIKDLLKEKTGVNHYHINNSDFTKEITVATYAPGQVSDEGLTEQINQLILAAG